MTFKNNAYSATVDRNNHNETSVSPFNLDLEYSFKTSRSIFSNDFFETSEYPFGKSNVKNNDFINSYLGLTHFPIATEESFQNQFINVKSTSSESESPEVRDENFLYINNFKTKLIGSILEEHFEFGYSNKTDLIVKEAIQKYPDQIKNELNKIFINKFDDVKITASIMFVISRLEYGDIYPNGKTMALSALTHKNIEVKESAVRAIEAWEEKSFLPTLKKVDTNITWLQDYISEIILDLENL